MSPQPRSGRLALAATAPACPLTRPLPLAAAASTRTNFRSGRFICPADAPALPFVPFVFKSTREIRAMLSERRARSNRPRHRPPLALALFGLLASLLAAMTSSPAGESALTAAVPVIQRSASELEVALVDAFAREHGLCELSFNDAAER